MAEQGMSEQVDLVELLIEGARYGDMDDVGAALSEGVPVDSRDEHGRTALHMAAANGYLEIVDRLLAAGANPESKNEDGNTPLHWACLNHQKEAVLKLMTHGADASTLNSVGRTSMDEALTHDFQDIVDLINTFNPGSIEVEVVEEEEGDDMEEDTEAGGSSSSAVTAEPAGAGLDPTQTTAPASETVAGGGVGDGISIQDGAIDTSGMASMSLQ